MKRRTKIIIATIALLLVAAIAFGVVKKRSKKGVEVTTAKVERADLSSKVTANGKIEAQRKVDLSANVMGQITNLAVREGDVVAKGDFLLQIDKTQLAASAAGAEASVRALFHDRGAARANAAEALRNYERAQKSYAEKLIPLAELERSRSALESARESAAALEGRIEQGRAGVAGARDTLSKTTIKAPMGGIVTALPVEEGEVAVIGTMNNPGTVLMTISDMSVVEAVMDVDETDIPNVKVGQTATVTVDAYPNKTFEGKVTEVASSPRERGATAGSEAINFEVKIQLQDPPAAIRPGFSCSAEILTGTRPKATSVPIQALIVREKETKGKPTSAKPQEEEGVYLFDAKTGIAKFRTITTGLTGESSTEVVTGIKEGDEIITGPFKALREIKDGDKVRIAKEKDGKGKGGEKSGK